MMTTVTKRDLNQRTADVLAEVDRSTEPVVITERGQPRWRITRVTTPSDPLERLRAEGMTVPPKADPAPWPERHRTAPDPTRVDQLLASMRGDD